MFQVDYGIVGDCSEALKLLNKEIKKLHNQKELQSKNLGGHKLKNGRKRDSLGFKQTGSVIKPQQAIQKLI